MLLTPCVAVFYFFFRYSSIACRISSAIACPVLPEIVFNFF